MSERPSTRPVIEDIRWASIDQTEVVDPSGGLKDDGYPDSAIPANEEHNSQWYRQYLREVYQEGVTPRVFEALSQALDAGIPVGEIFRVLGFSPGTDVLLASGDLLQTIVVGGLVDVATDGQRMFRAAGATVEAFPAFSGAASAWGPVTPDPGNPPVALEADGLNLYVSNVNSRVFLLDPATGTTLQTIVVGATVGDLASNGSDLIVAVTATNIVNVYGNLGGVPSGPTATLTHGAAINAVALDHDQGYMAGAPGTGGNLIHAFSLATPGAAFLWGTILPITTINDIKADGEFVYVVGTATDPDDNVFCLRRTDGALVWCAQTFGSSAGRCAIDDRYLWTSAGTSPVALDKSCGQAVWAPGILTSWDPAAADGCCVVGMDGTDDIVVRAKADLVTRFLSVEDDDAKRRPFPRIALPVRERAAGSAKQRFDVFGQEYQSAEDKTAASTSGSTPIQFLRLTTPVTMPAGTYELSWFYVWNHSSLTTDFAARIMVDDTTLLIDPNGNGNHRQEPSDVAFTQRHLAAGSTEVVLAAGSSFFDLDFWSPSASGTAQIFHGFLRLIRVL